MTDIQDQAAEDRRLAHSGPSGDWDADTPQRPKGRRIGALAMLWPYARQRPWTLAMVATFLIGGVITSLAIPLVFRDVVDAGFDSSLPREEMLASIDFNFALLLGVSVALGLLSALRSWFVSRFGEGIGADLRADLYDRMLSLSSGFHNRMRSGEAVSRLTADIGLIQTFLTSSASLLVRTLLNTVGALAMMLWINWQLGGALLLIIPIAIIPLFFIGRVIRKQSSATQSALAEAGSEAAETLDAIELVQAFTQEDSRLARFRSAVTDTYRRAMRLATTRSVMIIAVSLVFFGGIVGILWMGARAVVNDELGAGDLSAMVLYALYAGSGFGMLAEVYGEVMRAAGAADRAREVFSEEPDLTAPATPTPIDTATPTLSFTTVSYTYPGAAEPALKGIDLSIKPGEFVALVGPSGAGKSSVFRLALRLADPDSGSVGLSGTDARQADPKDWRRNFAYVPQEATLFTGTVRDNLLLARQDLTDAEMEEALRLAQAFDFVQEKGGLGADLGKLGRALSGGQRQRLALARAFARGAPILLLDEATSALDSESEAAVQTALENAASRFTIIAIAHRLSTVRRADRIVVMDEGQIVDEGRHEDLVQRGGLYARLARLQFVEAAEA